MKAIAAALFAALILVTGATAGVPDELVALVDRVTKAEEINTDQATRIYKLEADVKALRAKLKRRHFPTPDPYPTR